LKMTIIYKNDMSPPSWSPKLPSSCISALFFTQYPYLVWMAASDHEFCVPELLLNLWILRDTPFGAVTTSQQLFQVWFLSSCDFSLLLGRCNVSAHLGHHSSNRFHPFYFILYLYIIYIYCSAPLPLPTKWFSPTAT